MRLPVLVALALLSASAAAAAPSPRRPEVTIVFLGADIREPLDDAPAPPGIARRRFRIRVDARNHRAPRARLYAALASEAPGRSLRVDGVTLSTVPRLISAETPLGAPESHTLEVEGPPGAEETIVWTAEVR
jgi:hypothetical protein